MLHNDLTVRENLAYSTWLRSNINMVSEAKGEVVDDVIDLLRLRHVQVPPKPPQKPATQPLASVPNTTLLTASAPERNIRASEVPAEQVACCVCEALVSKALAGR